MGGILLIRLSPLRPFLFASEGVHENCLVCVIPIVVVVGVFVMMFVAEISFPSRMAGREGEEIGILKTFARDARTGERERISVVLFVVSCSGIN